MEKCVLTVGKSKTDGGEGRTIPLNDDLFAALTEHSVWFTKRFGNVGTGRASLPWKGQEARNG